MTGHLPFDDENIRMLLKKVGYIAQSCPTTPLHLRVPILQVKSGRYVMPHNISYEAQDLIRKILVTDPNKRITVSFPAHSQVTTSPWYWILWEPLIDGTNQAPSLVCAGYTAKDYSVAGATQPPRNWSTGAGPFADWRSDRWNYQVFMGRNKNRGCYRCLDGKGVSAWTISSAFTYWCTFK